MAGALCALALALAGTGAARAREVPDELLVGMQPSTSRGHALGLLREAGAQPLAEIPDLGLHRVQVPPPAREAVARALARRPDVAFVEPHRLFEPAIVPDDPRFGEQWHHATLRSAGAWSRSLAFGRIVAVLDSGVDAAHPDLADAVLSGWNFWTDEADTTDVTGHGTRVAGVAASVTNNGRGVAGVAWGAAILPVRVTGGDGWASSWAIAEGLEYAVARGAHVANLSFGELSGSQTVLNAAAYAVERGTLVVASAGNCGCTQSYPDSPWLLVVGATTRSDALAGFSSRGDHVDLVAPGKSLQTTRAGGGYAGASGTSFSAPIVAGLVALLGASEPGLTPAQLEARVLDSAVDLGPAGWDASFGAGRTDAAAALGEGSGRRCGLGFELILLLPPLFALRPLHRACRAKAA